MKYLQYGRTPFLPASVYRSLVLTLLSISAILALFYSSMIHAQEGCGTITSINPYSGAITTVPIEDCSDPFGSNTGTPDDVALVVGGVEVESGATAVQISQDTFSTVYFNYRFSGAGPFGYSLQVYEKQGENYTEIDFQPLSRYDVTLEEGVAILEEYFSGDPDVDVYREAYINDDEFSLNAQQQDVYIEFVYGVLPQLLQERYGSQVPLGRYWFVFTEQFICVSQVTEQKSLLARVMNVLLPVAHAQFGVPCSPGYIPKRFVIELDVLQSDIQPTGASSVLFLPGIQASRLYAGEDIVLPGLANNIEVGDKLWEQTNDKRIAALAMDERGESVYQIYTQDVLEEVTGRFFGANIYKGFLGLLDDLKDDEVIDNYVPFAYDWRYSVFDVATGPVQYESEVKLLKDEVLKLATDSHTEKVTIVAHSNGGLVAKALLHEYGDNELQGVIDKVVMIGTPQLGTPKGVSALLHGQVMEGFGDVLTSDQVLRDTIVNMPGTYTLLPSTRYLDEVADQPLVSIPDGFDLSVYDGVSTRAELNALLLDTEGVVGSDPTIQEPLQLNETLLNNALAEQAILDAWQPPAGVEVYEVVGTGIPTPAAIHYEFVPSVTCPNAAAVFLVGQCEAAYVLKPKIRTTNQGDKTVVLGSARGQLGDKRTLTVNLVDADDLILRNRNHADLTEVPAIQTFVESVIRFPYVTEDIVMPEFSQLLSGYTIHAGHSPVTLRVITPDGSITGIVDGVIREDISGSQFLTLGGSSYVIIPDDVTDYTLEVVGTGNGVYTLETSTLSPDDVQSVIASFVASTTDTMRATMDVTDSVMGDLQTDFDGDGTIDEVRTAVGELVVETVVIEDTSEQVQTTTSQPSATRVTERVPVPQVLGANTTVVILEHHDSLYKAVLSIQEILSTQNLTTDQLQKMSEILKELSRLTNL